MPVGRIFLRLVDLLPLPSLRVQRAIAAAVILTQGGIAVTGAIVRVTASGLGCPTWPQCFPGSFTPIPHPEVAGIHQAVEFGNRMITFLVVLTAALAVLAVTRARSRREVLIYAWLMPASTVVQAVIGGITVLTGLLWWTVAIHLLASMTMVWVSVLLYVKIGEPDERRCPAPCSEAVAPVDHSQRDGAGRHPRDRNTGHGRGPARGRQEHHPTGATATGRDHDARAHALLAARDVPVAARRAGLRTARRARTAAGPAAARGARRRWCAVKDSSAPCSTSTMSRRRWWPSTSRVRPRALRPPPRYGRRCESGPRPRRSRAVLDPDDEIALPARPRGGV